MTKKSCRRCGKSLAEGARFCSGCGATLTGAETRDFNSLKTRPFVVDQADQTTNDHSAVTEALPPTQTTAQTLPSSYETEETPRLKITAPTMEQPKTAPPETAPPETTVTQSQHIMPPANPPSSGRKGLFLVAVVSVVVLGAGSFIFINSRRASGTQTAILPAEEVKPAASAQPSTAPSIAPSGQPTADANNQTQPQTEPTVDKDKSATTKNAVADTKSTPQAVAKSTPAAPKEKDSADGTGAAAHNVNQGITFFNSGRYQDAMREFEYVKKLDPGNKSVHYLIGQTYHKMGKLQEALESYRRCTSGVYASVARNNARSLEKQLGKTY